MNQIIIIIRNRPALTALAICFAIFTLPVRAQITSIPNADGSDLALNVTVSTNIDLSQAGDGSWTSSSTKPGYGTYDSSVWAVVFKYSSVNIAAGATVTFSNHITHAPVVWLVSGDVTINGNLSLDGQSWSADPLNLPEPGPGGFRGGAEYANVLNPGPGFGPGGGATATASGTYSGSYGNAQLVPLIGGSGGAGGSISQRNGGAGGGAILVAAGGAITINGSVHAIGGGGAGSGDGSGGGIRLVANQILGATGSISALGACHTCLNEIGIIRLETTNLTLPIYSITPTTQSVPPASTPAIFPGAGTASISVLSVSNANGNVTAPADPKAIMSANTAADDITLVTTNTVTIWLQVLNFPTTNGTVTVFVKQRNNVPQSTFPATYVNGTFASSIWQAPNVPLAYPAHTIIQARAAY